MSLTLLDMYKNRLVILSALFAASLLPAALAQAPTPEATAASDDVIARIRDEGLNHSRLMETLSYLTEVIGPRLTGSPNLKRANEWTRDKLASWGLTNAHLEAWGPFGRGWALKRFSAQVIEPQTIPLIGCPNAWSPGFDHPLVADVVFFDVKTNADLEKYKGQLAGAIVLASQPRELKLSFDPLAGRLQDTNLLRLANQSDPREQFASSFMVATGSRAGSGSGRRSRSEGAAQDSPEAAADTPAAGADSAPRRFAGGPQRRGSTRYLSFLAKEGAALIVNSSLTGEGGTYFVQAASVPGPDSRAAFTPTNAPRAWATNAPAYPAQITLAAEDYNRVVRMLQHGEKVKMAVDLQVQYYQDDLMAYNTVAEIPGSDLKNEIVMLGAHLDSWHAGTGATDNGAGVAAVMEAARILKALKLQPRRTIRVGLWSGEEQGLFGSRAYVTRHFGYYTNGTATNVLRSPKDPDGARLSSGAAATEHPASSAAASEERRAPLSSADARAGSATNSTPARRLVRESDYEKLSAYFNLDNGGGKIRGVYMQGNEAVRPLFRRWLEPFRDLDAATLTISNTGGTDHTSFDAVGLPGFQFIQDPLDYRARTHHSNEDVLDRIQPDDLKQAAVILAAFVYDAANLDHKLPRKPLP
jgi:hypothetical protein